MDRDLETQRQAAVRRYFAGEGVSSIATSLGRSVKWVRKWVERFVEGETTWFEEHTRQPKHFPRRCSREMEVLVIATRERLVHEGVHCGAEAIAWELESLGVKSVPSVRSIKRMIQRHQLVRRRSGPYEPKGKTYPIPLPRAGWVHQSDFVGPRYGRTALRFYSLNTIDVSSGRCAVQPLLQRDAQSTIDALWASWGRLGLPGIQQLDNDSVFYGSVRHPRGLGAVLRLCLWNDIEPWFIPPAEPWRNGVVEKFNDVYNQRFLRAVEVDGVDTLWRESLRFEERHNSRYRYSKLNGQTPLAALQASGRTLRFPIQENAPRHPLPKPESGRYHLIRFVRADGELDVFGEKFRAPAQAHHEYVRLTIDVARQRMGVYLSDQLLDEHVYTLR